MYFSRCVLGGDYMIWFAVLGPLDVVLCGMACCWHNLLWLFEQNMPAGGTIGLH